MSRGIALATALILGALTVAPAAADVVTVTGNIDGLDVTEVSSCSAIDATLVVNRTSADDVIAGTEFTLTKLAGIDLAEQAGWNAVKGMDVDKARAAAKDGIWTATSDAAGNAVFGGLPIGAYFVSAVAPDDGRHLTPASFIITLPTGTEAGWNCQPVINAKFEPGPEPTPTKPAYPPFEPESWTTTVTMTTTPQRPDSVLSINKQPAQRTDKVLGIRKNLAYTGAAVIGIVAAAAGLLALGLVLVRRKKNEEG